jgi:hypothetical protein
MVMAQSSVAPARLSESGARARANGPFDRGRRIGDTYEIDCVLAPRRDQGAVLP